MTRYLVLADTHTTPDRLDRIPDAVWAAAQSCDEILHAGDVMCRELLDALAERAPVHVVLGNNDVGLLDDLPEQVAITADGVSIAMVHDSGARKGRENRMKRWFPEADLVIFGHSHEPVDTVTDHDQRLFNPGSPTTRRRQPRCSYGLITVTGGTIETELVLL